MINWLKTLMLFRLMILGIYLERLAMTKNWRNWKKMPNLDKYITTPKSDKLTTKYFTPRLKQAQLATKNDIDDFVKKTNNYFWWKAYNGL